MSAQYEVFRIVSGTWRENGYVVKSRATGTGIVIDPGCDIEGITKVIFDQQVHVEAILLTHAHHDHVDGVVETRDAAGGAVYLHSADATLLRRVNAYALMLGLQYIKVPTVDVWLSGAETLLLGDLAIEVVHLPGHTEGSVGYRIGDAFFVGDTILPEAVGRVDLPGGSQVALQASLVKAVSLMTPKTIVYPGHGDTTSLVGLQTFNAAMRAVLAASGMLREGPK